MRSPEDIDDPDAPASEEESARGEEFRLALEDPARSSADADLARALSLAHSPREISPEDHAAIVERAVTAAKTSGVHGRRRSNVIQVAFGVAAAAISLAAGVVFVVGSLSQHQETAAPTAALPLVQLRSTQPLFREPFREGNASARIDRIAMARSSDLRDNRFARWGVR
ncbi:MAG: hypothetical protein ABIP39_11795 [Polyangiaceae bacterium]